MSFLDRIDECNSHDLSHFHPFLVADQRVGWIREDRLAMLRVHPDLFEVGGETVSLSPALGDFESRTAALEPFVRSISEEGLSGRWRDEPYPVAAGFSDPPLFAIDRSAVPFFGVPAYGVHMNGFVRRDDQIHIWIGRRSRHKHTYPGLLDNMVAGGQPMGLSLRDNLIKEAAEEASVPEAMARQAIPVGAISYVAEAPEGIKPDAMFCFDLEVPADFTPVNTDGEIEEFFLWPAEKVATIVEGTNDFKFNCNLVIIDFLIRHGFIPPDHSDYLALVKGLRQ